MSGPKKRLACCCLFLVFGLLTVPGRTRAADLKEGVEQLAVQLGRSVPEGRVLRVAVTDFPDLQGITSDLGRYIAERLTTRLSGQTQKFRVIERRRLGLVLGELKFSMSDLVDPNKAKQLGKMLGVEALVAGSISDLGNQVDVDARIIEIETNNILPGVSTTLSKDQVVTQLLASGREAAPAAPPPPVGQGPGIPEPPPPQGPQRPRVHPVGKRFEGLGGRVILFNVEIVEGRFLRFNFSFEWTGISMRDKSVVEAYLDNPRDTTFLIDQLGRQYPLVQATGISADQPIRVPVKSTKRFTLTFPLDSKMESFTYQTIVFMRRADNQQGRLQIRAQEQIHIRDFR